MITEVKKHVNSLGSEADKISKTSSDVISRLEKLEKLLEEHDLEKIDEELKHLSAEISVISSYANKPEKAVDYESKIKDIYSSLGKQRVDIDTLKSEIESIKSELVSLKADAESIKAELDGIRSDIDSIQASAEGINLVRDQTLEIMKLFQSLLDKILQLESRIQDLSARQKAILSWKGKVAGVFGEEIPVKSEKVEDEEIEKMKKRVEDIMKLRPELEGQKKSGGKPRPKKKATQKAPPGMPVIEEITIGEEKPKKSRKSEKDKVEAILDEIRETDPRKWNPLKSELVSELESRLNNLRSRINEKNPPNKKTLDLMLMQAELGIASLPAAFEAKNYGKLEVIVRKIMSILDNVKGSMG